MHLNRDEVVTACNECYDEPAMKLEWGTAECFAAMNQVSPKGFKRVVDGLRKLDSFVVQALFMRSSKADNTTPVEIEGWLALLEELKPRSVGVYSLDRPPAAEAQAEVVPREDLDAIASRVRERGLEVEVY